MTLALANKLRQRMGVNPFEIMRVEIPILEICYIYSVPLYDVITMKHLKQNFFTFKSNYSFTVYNIRSINLYGFKQHSIKNTTH